MARFYKIETEDDKIETGLRLVRVTVPAFPEIVEFAEHGDIQRVAAAAIEAAIGKRRAKGAPIPDPVAVKGDDGLMSRSTALPNRAGQSRNGGERSGRKALVVRPWQWRHLWFTDHDRVTTPRVCLT